MNKLTEFIKKLLLESKSSADIAEAILNNEDLNEETKNLSIEEIAKAVEKAKKINEARIAAKKLEDKTIKDKEDLESKKVNDTEMQKKIEEGVKDYLKTIPANQFKNEFSGRNEVKIFDFKTGEMAGTKIVTPQYKAFNDMLRAIHFKDINSALALSDQIDMDNTVIRGHDAKDTPTTTDIADNRGRFSIPTEVASEISQLTYLNSVMLQKAKTDVLTYNGKVYPTIGDMTFVYITDEGTGLTETNPTFAGPSIAMKRFGGFSAVSNEMLRQKGADVTQMFMIGYGSAEARFLDLHMAIGNITTNADAQDGIVFQANTTHDTAIARASLAISDLGNMLVAIDDEASLADMLFIGNRLVKHTVGNLETTGGHLLFPTFLNGTTMAPYGVQFWENTKIVSTLDVGGDARTTGTDDVLILVDMSKFIVGIDQDLRIDTSKDFAFTTDLTYFRGIRRIGWGLIFAKCARALELTN